MINALLSNISNFTSIDETFRLQEIVLEESTLYSYLICGCIHSYYPGAAVWTSILHIGNQS